jgi:predicted CXXCH cytochrome family protein
MKYEWIMKHRAFLYLSLLAVSFVPDAVFADVIPPKNPNSAKGCAICHFRWIDTFFVEGKGTDLVDYTSEKVEASPKMCMSCHDGGVMDSRERLMNNNGHKTDMAPPADMKIPEIFPLDEAGKVQCSTCHTAHGVPSDPLSGETIFLRISNRDSAMCRMCHTGKEGTTDRRNHITGEVKRAVPEKLVLLGAHTSAKRDMILCETCHTAHGSRSESYLLESARGSGLCLECHTDKDGSVSDTRKRTTHVINVEPTSAKIPEELLASGAKLGFNGNIICQSCHRIHNGKTEKNLLVFGDIDNTALCLTCHQDKRYVADTKHNMNYSSPEKKNSQGQTVADSGVCSACHLPHKIAITPTGDGEYITQFCQSCHSERNVAEKSRLNGIQHPLETASMEKIKKEGSELPLYSKDGISGKGRLITCMTCHEPHRWNPTSEKGETSKEIKGDRYTSFLRKQSPEVCRECHSEKFNIENSEHDLSKVTQEEKNILKQTPMESGLCGTCHIVHNSQTPFLWGREKGTPGEFTVQNLCQDCHSSKGAADKKVIKDYSHPVMISLAERNMSTDLPLFDEKGKISGNGSVVCATCHDPHQWDSSGMGATQGADSEGDARNSFLRMEASPSPVLCNNCHQKEALVENTDHDLKITSPESKNVIGQTPLESGTCGVCHQIHNSATQLKLWAQNTGAGRSAMEELCNSCHSKTGSAKDKIPLIASHPADIIVVNVGRNDKESPGYFPIFNLESGQSTTFGGITCSSCHNAHRWDPKSLEKGKGVKTEGDTTNSFLRMQAMQMPCQDCHGAEALYRYLNYHSPVKRNSAVD